MWRLADQSSTAEMIAPDWDRSASLPGSGATWAKLALRPIGGTKSPKQFGPMTRKQWGLAASEHRLLEAVGLRQPGGQHDGRPGAPGAQFGDQLRHGPGRRGDHREIGRFGQGIDIRIADQPAETFMVRIDRPDRTFEPGGPQVFQNRGADGQGLGRRPDQGD